MVFLMTGIAGAGRWFCRGPRSTRLTIAVTVVLCMLWLQYPLRADVPQHRPPQGGRRGGYATSVWQNSPLVTWLQEHPLSGQVCHEQSGCRLSADASRPRVGPVVAGCEQSGGACPPQGAAGTQYVVWFHRIDRTWLYDLREIASRCRTEEVATFPDGCVLKCLGEGGPAYSGFYRFWLPRSGRHFYTIDKADGQIPRPFRRNVGG